MKIVVDKKHIVFPYPLQFDYIKPRVTFFLYQTHIKMSAICLV